MIERFIQAQNEVYLRALNEIKSGRKQTHWMWFIFPQITGLGLSANNAYNQRITTSTPNFTPQSAKLGVFYIFLTPRGDVPALITPNSAPKHIFSFARPRLYIGLRLVGHI